MAKEKALPPIWEVPDALWARIEPVLAELDPPKRTGRKRVEFRKQLNGVIFPDAWGLPVEPIAPRVRRR